MDAASDAAGDATDAAMDAAGDATGAAADAAADAGEGIAGALDPQNFDADSVIGAIDSSSLDDATKSTLKSVVEAAKSNPALVQPAIDQVKAALGL